MTLYIWKSKKPLDKRGFVWYSYFAEGKTPIIKNVRREYLPKKPCGDGTHHKNTALGLCFFGKIRREGEKPIEKNVKVVDEFGNILEATYPKRAKGLVKAGRARFVDENTICLACPPKTILEDNKMDNINIDKTTGEVVEIPASKYNLEYALEQIERIANDTEHLEKAFEDLKIAAQSNKDTPCGGSNDRVAAAIGDSVKCRETTNQKLIDFYSKMVDDLKPTKELDEKEMFLKFVANAEEKRRPGTGQPNYSDIWKAMKN